MENLSNLQKILIRILKEDKLMTQKELAIKMNVSTVAVNKWLNGGSIDSNKIPLLCTTLNVTPNELFGINENLEDREILNIIKSDPELKTFVLTRKK